MSNIETENLASGSAGTDRIESVDHVPNDPETTAFKRRARRHQSLWRETRKIEKGSQPYKLKDGKPFRTLGSRIDLTLARDNGYNFLYPAAREAVEDRLKPENRQPHQTLNQNRLYADLLSSMPMCFNLFAVLQHDLELADRAVHAWWPHVPGKVVKVHFEWSPGRREPGRYLENASAFDVAFELDLGNQQKGIFGVETKYHEDCRRESVPRSDRKARYLHVSAISGAFLPGSVEAILGTDLQQIWLDHLLALSMTKGDSPAWAWADFALVHPAQNPSYARATDRYRKLLCDPGSFNVMTIEKLFDADVFPREMAEAFTDRYLWSDETEDR